MRLPEREKEARDGVKYILESYHYVGRQSAVDRMREDGVKVFLDSGAFSAYTKGVDVDIEAYCDYIHRNEDIIEKIDGNICASVLDGIGDPLLTYQNQKHMESLGVRPLPCFHYGEDERYLEYYVANYDHITLGGMVPISTPQLILWLDRIWEKYLTDGSGNPRLKVHGFGLTANVLMERYPWYSVDSSSWVQIAANGNIIIPNHGTLAVSKQSPDAKKYLRHVDTLPPIQRQAIEETLSSQGFDLERLQNEYSARWAYNCWYFTYVNEEILEDKDDGFDNPIMELFE